MHWPELGDRAKLIVRGAAVVGKNTVMEVNVYVCPCTSIGNDVVMAGGWRAGVGRVMIGSAFQIPCDHIFMSAASASFFWNYV